MLQWIGFLLITGMFFNIPKTAHMSKKELLEAVSSKNEKVVEQCLHYLEKNKTTSENRAYLGVMHMKYASYRFFPTDKFSTFNKGKSILENEIAAHPENAEYRFLRLIIQENAPGIVMYSDNIITDSKKIKSAYATFSEPLKSFVKDYAKDSKALKKAGF